MPLKKLVLRAGVNQENTRYTNENGWWSTDKVRFRQGTPEKIGGWSRISTNVFIGICRSLWNWVTLAGQNLLGIGTNQKFYIENGAAYYDITPTKPLVTLTNPFATTVGLAVVVVTDPAGGFATGDFVTFTGATVVGDITLSGEYKITTLSPTTYQVTASNVATSTATGGGTVYAVYQIPSGAEFSVPITGWGAGAWGAGPWGIGQTTATQVRLWSQANFGSDLLFAPKGGALYYWRANVGIQPSSVTISIASPAVLVGSLTLAENTAIILQTNGALPTGLLVGTTYYVKNVVGTTFNLSLTPGGAAINTTGTQSGTHSVSARGILVSSFSGALSVPTVQNFITISDSSRFVFAFGTNDYGSTIQNPMLIRWSDQESITDWTPSATNQAGSVLLSHGSELIAFMQTRQEIVVWSDSSLYSLQYVGPPVVWSSQLLADNISIASMNAAATASGVVYWMGIDKFYKYDGRVQTLRCDLLRFIYNDINLDQADQIFASTNEGFNEVWFFYCSKASNTVDRYVVFNYSENNGEGAWYYGEMARTAWLDSGLRNNPIAATYSNNIVSHESGLDNNETGTTLPIRSYVSSAEFDIEDGDRFGFVWRILPDITFRGSTTENPSGTLTLIPMQNSGSGYNSPTSVAGSDSAPVTRNAVLPIEKFTGQIYVRVRGRQMIIEFENEQLGSTWQLGAPRIDIKLDGRR
ncbi:hypothetical protein UFOVP393_7 [uncultured Caudovirales phage]|uniref:Uncharacterized protein n=1 Tax=uncultured Caudovirales phage TaxID=2100421 RepID=A0A6J7X046_9CAUD|nr:hypothetical protein UFOVP393_7 [uncultured Caudovirales phage]